MAYPNSTVPVEKMLLNFVFVLDEDPMQAMLKWLCEKLMEAEVEGKLGAEKSERTNDRRGYRTTRGIESMSRCLVSIITKALNKHVSVFRQETLKNTYPILWVNAL